MQPVHCSLSAHRPPVWKFSRLSTPNSESDVSAAPSNMSCHPLKAQAPHLRSQNAGSPLTPRHHRRKCFHIFFEVSPLSSDSVMTLDSRKPFGNQQHWFTSMCGMAPLHLTDDLLAPTLHSRHNKCTLVANTKPPNISTPFRQSS